MTSRPERGEPEEEEEEGAAASARIIREIHDQYMAVLKVHLGGNEKRLQALLRSMGLIEESAKILLNSKMFYVPFLLTANI